MSEIEWDPCRECEKHAQEIEANEREVEKLEAENKRLREEIERIHIAVLRYESRHDRDPERGQLWSEVKLAFFSPAEKSSYCPGPDMGHSCDMRGVCIDCGKKRRPAAEAKS